MNYRFMMQAEEELNEATDWYNAQREGLGNEFKEQVREAIQRICRKPESSTLLEENVRLHRVARFPYGIVYHTTDQAIEIVAVMHLRRRPDYWHRRLDPPNTEDT